MRHRLETPNFRNLGVILRTLLLVNGLLLLYLFVSSVAFRTLLEDVAFYSGLIQPILLLSLSLLYGGQPLLARLRYAQACFAMWGIVLLSTFIIHYVYAEFLFITQFPSLIRAWLLASLLFFITIYYFCLLEKAHSPALDEAKLQALQARIRPHFLFNSMNAVLSLIRSHPKQAETALEDLADLFRVLMADNRNLVPLAQEIALCRQYCGLEKLRLEERLNVVWQIDEKALGAKIPPLILQPLLENAVYHGIEPIAEGGTITIHIAYQDHRLQMTMTNPLTENARQHQGNKMAINNIKERLHLHFDIEAKLTIKREQGTYQVQIETPYVGV